MMLPVADETSCFPLFFRIWEPAITYFIEANLEPGDCFIDIGANVGYYSLLSSKIGASPMAFEPSPRILPILYRNLALNGVDSSVVREVALSDRVGEARLFDGPDSNLGLSSLSPEGSQRGLGSHLVRTQTVADHREAFLAASMIKIDVEGHEHTLLRQMFAEPTAQSLDATILCELDLGGPHRTELV